jgi:hypothetical protein
MSLTMSTVSSDWVHSVGYDKGTSDFYLKTKSGSIYRYKNVPESVFQRVRDAFSVGGAYNDYIKGGRYGQPDFLTQADLDALTAPVAAPVATTPKSYPLHEKLYGAEGKALIGLLEYMRNTGRIAAVVNTETVLHGYLGISTLALQAEKEQMVKDAIDAIRGS